MLFGYRTSDACKASLTLTDSSFSQIVWLSNFDNLSSIIQCTSILTALQSPPPSNANSSAILKVCKSRAEYRKDGTIITGCLILFSSMSTSVAFVLSTTTLPASVRVRVRWQDHSVTQLGAGWFAMSPAVRLLQIAVLHYVRRHR